MTKLVNDNGNLILEFIKVNPLLSSREIHDGLKLSIGYATVKRILQKLITQKLITASGQGKGTKYKLSQVYELLHSIDLDEYFKKEIDERKIKDGFNFSLITDTLSDISLFTNDELSYLDTFQNKYVENISKLTDLSYKKELERLAIDLSWKSSQIEGNT